MKRHRSLHTLPALAVLAIAGCASGSAIVTGVKRAAIYPERVTLYLEPPAEFDVSGLVSASSDAGWSEQGSVDYAVKELKSGRRNLARTV